MDESSEIPYNFLSTLTGTRLYNLFHNRRGFLRWNFYVFHLSTGDCTEWSKVVTGLKSFSGGKDSRHENKEIRGRKLKVGNDGFVIRQDGLRKYVYWTITKEKPETYWRTFLGTKSRNVGRLFGVGGVCIGLGLLWFYSELSRTVRPKTNRLETNNFWFLLSPSLKMCFDVHVLRFRHLRRRKRVRLECQ